jgi:hypothetical protein
MRTMAACGWGDAGWGYGWAHGLGWPAGRVAAALVRSVRAEAGGTLRRCLGGFALMAGSGLQIGFSAHGLGLRSGTRAKFGHRACLIGEKVIGRGMGTIASRVGRRSPLVSRRSWRILRPFGGAVLASRGTFALLHQPARQHSRGIFLQPGIEQLRDLLAEISGVAEPRKLVTLQRVPRRREKELPRWRGSVIQRGLQRNLRINIINIVNGTQIRTYCGKVWKSLPVNREPSRLAVSWAKPL